MYNLQPNKKTWQKPMKEDNIGHVFTLKHVENLINNKNLKIQKRKILILNF